MDNLILQLGVGGAVAVYIVKTVLEFILKYTSSQKRRQAEERGETIESKMLQSLLKIEACMATASREVHELYDWHNVKDDDHVFAWYGRKSLSANVEKLQTAVIELARSAEKQTALLEQLCIEEEE